MWDVSPPPDGFSLVLLRLKCQNVERCCPITLMNRPSAVFGFPWSYHAVGAAGQRASGLGAALSGEAVEVLHLLAQQLLQALDVLDGVAQDLHLGEALARVGRGAAPQRLEGVVDLLEAPALPHGGRPPAVHEAGLALAGLAGPLEAVSRLVGGSGDPDVLVLLGSGQLHAGPELQVVGGQGARSVVEGLGWGENIHGSQEVKERRPLSDMRGLLPRAPLICPRAKAQGPHWSDLITMAHWPSLGLVQLPPCLSPPSTLPSFPHLHSLVFSYSSLSSVCSKNTEASSSSGQKTKGFGPLQRNTRSCIFHGNSVADAAQLQEKV